MGIQGVKVVTLLYQEIVPFANLCTAINRLAETGVIGDEHTCDCGRRLLLSNSFDDPEKTVILAITPGQASRECVAKNYLERD